MVGWWRVGWEEGGGGDDKEGGKVVGVLDGGGVYLLGMWTSVKG